MKRITSISISIIIVILCITLLSFLRIKPDSSNLFFSNHGGGDSLSIPLIEPYEATKIKAIPGWFINLHLPFEQRANDMKSYGSIDGVEKIAIQNNIIMIYTPLIDSTAVSLNYKIAHWFIISPNENLEMGFEYESEFNEFTIKYGVQEINWEKPDDIYKKIQDTGCLEWALDCR